MKTFHVLHINKYVSQDYVKLNALTIENIREAVWFLFNSSTNPIFSDLSNKIEVSYIDGTSFGGTIYNKENNRHQYHFWIEKVFEI